EGVGVPLVPGIEEPDVEFGDLAFAEAPRHRCTLPRRPRPGGSRHPSSTSRMRRTVVSCSVMWEATYPVGVDRTLGGSRVFATYLAASLGRRRAGGRACLP